MRVLHILHTSVPALATGYSVRSDYIMRFQRQQGIASAVVSSGQHPNGETLHEVVDGFAFWRTPALERKLPMGLREWTLMRRLQGRIETAIREWKPAIVHAHSPMLVGIPAVHAARAAGLPVVYELRDLWENPSVDRGKFKVGSPLYRAAQMFENYVLTGPTRSSPSARRSRTRSSPGRATTCRSTWSTTASTSTSSRPAR